MSNMIENAGRRTSCCNGADFTAKAAQPSKDMRPADSRPDVLLRDQIELHAYHIWLASGGGQGNETATGGRPIAKTIESAASQIK